MCLITISSQILLLISCALAQSQNLTLVAESRTIILSTTQNNNLTFVPVPTPSNSNDNDTIVTLAEFNWSACDLSTADASPCGILTRWLGDFNDNKSLSLSTRFNETMPICRANVSVVSMVWRESEINVEAIALFDNSSSTNVVADVACKSTNISFMVDASGCSTAFVFPGLQTLRSECVDRFVPTRPTTTQIQTSSPSSTMTTFDDPTTLSQWFTADTFPPTSCPRGLFGPMCDGVCRCSDVEKPLCNDGIAGDGSCRPNDVRLQPPLDGVYFAWMLGMFVGGALGVGLAWYRDPEFMRERVFSAMPSGWRPWLTHPMVAIVVVVFCMTYQMLSQVFATVALWKSGLALVVRNGGSTVRWLSTTMAPLLSCAALTGKVYALLACAMLESTLLLYVDDERGNRPFYRGGGCFAWTRQRWQIAILKVAFVVADFLMIGLAPMTTLAQYDWFMNMIHGDLVTVIYATDFSEYTLYGVGIAAGVILALAVASCLRWCWDKETRQDPNFDCALNCKESFQGMVMCHVLLCLTCLAIFAGAGVVWSFWQFKEIDDLLKNGVTLPESFWGAFTVKAIVVALDLIVTVLALAGQIGKYLPAAQSATGMGRAAAPELAERGQLPVAAVIDEANGQVLGAAEDNVQKAGQQRRQHMNGHQHINIGRD